jgi:hypothetical protein
MATVTKDFRVKSGLVVEGSTATVNGKNVITAGTIDAKGDLLVGSADDAVARLAIGTNGQVLTANSGATYGVQWSDPAAVGVFDTQITFEGATADSFETTLTVVDPTADRTITLPNVTGTVVTSGDTGTVTATMLASDSVTTAKILNANVTEAKIADGAVTSAKIANDTIVDADINSVAAIAQSKIANLTTDLAAKLALAGGTMSGAIAMGTNKITGLGDPTSAQDAATKAYVDSAAQGIDWKASVRAATTANVTLASALENGDVLDGVTLATGNRVLVKDQSTGSQNGIYVVASSGAPTRSTDCDISAELTSNFAVFVEEGTVNADQGYVLTNDGAITVGTTALVFTQFTGLGQVTAGNGLTKTGNIIDVNPGTGINITSDQITNTGVLSIAGTANQITASASTGAITLSGPQDLHSAATPTFAGVSVGSGSVTAGSVTLTDALIGTATQALIDGTATVVDSWSATTYSSAKYLVQMKKGTEIQTIEILLNVDGGNNVALTEYADVINAAGSLGTTDADYSGGNVRLLVTASNGTMVKVHKTLIEA